MDDDDGALSPEETLQLIERQQAVAARRLTPDPLLMYAPWGLAWMLGFGAFFLTYGLDGEPILPISWKLALAVLVASQLGAGAFTAYVIWRQNIQVRGESTQRGMMYGYAWFVAMVSMFMVAARFRPMLDVDEIGLFYSSFSLLVVAILYMAGGAIWRTWSMFFIGVWTAIVNTVGVALGPGWHSLLIAVLVGGGFFATGVWLRRQA
ncbi:hypothetical protein [Nonomuraea sp. NPDC046570]|uniref:hypothetical protein n=1 Tax=Nonomuraea sp. NPDC046570 TaxID=3155255 RepID=UPI0033D8AACB